MKLKVVIHEAEEGGYWAEVPAIPGCMTQGETMRELIENLYDAVEGCLSVDRDGGLIRVTGSHHIFVRQGSDLRISVPVHGNQNHTSPTTKTITKCRRSLPSL